MTRIKFFQENNTASPVKLDLSQMGELTSPLKGSRVNVVKFSIPNSDVPVLEFTNSKYQFTLTYNGFEYSQYVDFEDRGTTTAEGYQNIYEIDHLCSMFNTALENAITGLNALVSLPGTASTDFPRVIYNIETSKYELIALATYYGSTIVSPIKIYCNTAMFYVFQSMPVVYHPTYSTDKQYEFYFKQIVENTYLTNYIKIVQERNTINNYVQPRNIILSTSLPVENMIFSSSTRNANQSGLAVVQTYNIPYFNGVLDHSENLEFIQPVNEYRSCKLTNVDIYAIQMQILYEKENGDIRNFYLPPYRSARIELEFN